MGNENQLLENKQMREECVGRIEVLNKVKELLLLPNTDFATTEMVANYYETKKKTIEKLVERNNEELTSDGYRVLTGEELKIIKYANGIKPRGKQLAIFPKRAILKVGMLLRDSEIANKVKQELGLPSNSSLFLRKEIKFKRELDKAIEFIRRSIRYDRFFDEEYYIDKNKGLYQIICGAINGVTNYVTQYPCCNNKYRIDFYFQKLNIAVEYDEKYHNNRIKKDNGREYEIIRDIYINKYYNKYSDKEIKELGFRNKENMFDIEYKENMLECSFDLTRFVRIKEGDEIGGLMHIISAISTTALSLIDSRGMSCKYEDLIN